MQRKYHCINFVSLPSQLHQNPYICMIWKPLICPHTYYLFIQKNWKIHAHTFKCNWNFFHIFQHSNCVQKQHSLPIITVFLHSTNKFTPSTSCMFPLIYTPAIILPFCIATLKAHLQPPLQSTVLESILSYLGKSHATSGHQQLSGCHDLAGYPQVF